MHITKLGFALRASDKSGDEPDQKKEHILWDEVLMTDLGAKPMTHNTSKESLETEFLDVSHANVVTRAGKSDGVASLLNGKNLAVRGVTPSDGHVKGVNKARNGFMKVQNKRGAQQNIGADVSHVMMVRASGASSNGESWKAENAGKAVAKC